MAWQGVEIEIEVPCAGGQKHPVRLRFTGWGEFEVAYNPCEELLGPVFARMAACTHYLHEAFPEAFHDDTDLKRRLVEAFGAAGAPAVPALIQALGDSECDVRRAAAEALGKLGDPQAVPALIQALGDRREMFAVRQRRRWAISATPKPCPRSSKHWGIGLGCSPCGSGGVGANSATPKPSPRSSKHWGIGVRMFACSSGGVGRSRRPPSRARAHPSTGGLGGLPCPRHPSTGG
jgi:hypothetical protein